MTLFSNLPMRPAQQLADCRTIFRIHGGGGYNSLSAAPLFLSFFILLTGFLPAPAFSQTGSSCNQWAIEVCEAPLSYRTDIYGNPGCADNCFRVYYHFYLVRAGAQSDLQTEQTFTFTDLSLIGTLGVTAGNSSATGPGLSQVNVKESVACTTNFPGLNNPGNPSSPILNYSPSDHKFTYQVSSGTNQPVLSWSVYGRLPLFVLAVDVFPGETVEPSNLSFSFTLTDANGANPVVCDGVAASCTSPQNLAKTIAQPTNQCTSSMGIPFFRIGSAVDAPAAGFPKRKKMPVWVYEQANTTFSWNEVDFLISVATGQSMIMPTIEGGLIPASAVKPYALGSGYRIYTHHTGTVQIQNGSSTPNSGNILFYIVIDGPQLESECASVDVAFTGHARIDGGSFSCCKPVLGGTVTALWDATNCVTAHCAEVRLAAVHNSVTQSSNCGNVLYFDLFVNSTQNADLTDVRLALKIKKTGTFALSIAGTVSPYCSPGSCITVTDISADYLRVEYAVSSLSNLNLFANTPKLLATVALTTSDNGCISGIDFLDAVVFKTGATAACLPSWQSEFPENATADDICAVGHIFQVSVETESGTPIEAWNYYVDYHDDNFTNCLYHSLSPDGSTVSRCVCILQNTEQNVVLKKADNYLNGVSTYDLVLISKHIINVLPLSGFNMLAADANMSGSVTTFDVVELRKLILGIYSELPAANSWRFIDKDLKSAVQNSNNPFLIVHSTNQGGKTYSDIMDDIKYADEEFDEFSLPPTANLDSKAEFTGFKVGDVNNTALPSFTQQQTDDRAAGVLPLGTKNLEGRAGTMIEIPVFSLARQSLSGWQMALRFDTSVLQVTGARWPADIPYGAMQDRGWHLAQPGELRLLWFDGKVASSFEAGTALFFVQARLRQDVRREQQLLYLAPNGISPEAYDKELRQLRLDLEPSDQPLLSVSTALETAALSVYRLSVYPNPAGVHFRLEIEAPAAAAARLEIRDVLGREVIRRSLDLAPGMNAVPDAQLPPLAQGQYIISLFTSAGVETIRLVKR
ncbi:MAG: T9SS type A sorting domain-containing protein [Saprospiraceae bacterium]|nr:T9SS type A sorting domain-containing protein [Saprospiraceae bacterium]